ncbi:MAG TPA: Gfo/Idh/MocA family oxidoreductase [Tepidisphaeraceae bacterium]|jgi:myo-inositol 2-dehydrogenase/D-chiro-inositol 1-dehydrogenase|nr:Gfo/Idh/MocA family oxidoreductase [Tepidisphaeraceae bacterium]
MDRLRIGIIGAGAIAASHLPQLLRRPQDVQIIAAADVNPVTPCVEKFSIPRLVADYREMLDDVDAVLICTPTHLHADMAIAAMRAGKAVFCEKPLARTLAQADAILAAQRETGRALQVGFVRRFDAEWLAWRSAVMDKAIGSPVVWRDIAASSGPAGRWFFEDAQGGGPFLDGCIHSLDFGLYTFGPIASIFCHGHTMKAGASAIDTGSATVRFASGDELLLAWSWGLPAGCRGTRVFEILGPGGLISWPNDEPKDAKERRFTITTGPDHQRHATFPYDALTPAYDRQMDEFIDVARGQKTPRAGGVEGREALRAALAILESACSGEVVTLKTRG